MLVQGVNSIFVYGTLRSDFSGPQARRLQQACGKPSPARVPGRIFDLGQYPGLVESSRGGDIVHGEIYQLPEKHAELLEQLDEYEDVPGGLYARRVFTATLKDGSTQPAYTYVYLAQPAGFHWIPGGDYVAHLRSKAAC